MLLTAYHDSHGNVVTLVTREAGAPPVHIGSRLPLLSAEVDEPTLTTDLSPVELQTRMTELRNSRRIELTATEARLVVR